MVSPTRPFKQNARRWKTYSQPQTRFTGASSWRKHSSVTTLAISEPTPPILPASCTIMSRPVFFTLSTTVCLSHGRMVRRSMTSTDKLRSSFGMCFSRAAGGEESSDSAVSMVYSGVPQETIVRSFPGRRISAEDRGRVYEDRGTCSTEERYRTLGSKNTTGLSSRMAANSSPLAWIGPRGTTTWSGGQGAAMNAELLDSTYLQAGGTQEEPFRRLGMI